MRKHISDDIQFENDLHAKLNNPDYSPLDKLYAGRIACYGDFHCHSNSGGNSDGETTLEEWLDAMNNLKVDFVGLMDHRQVRHMFLDQFDTKYFICGTEPGGEWNQPNLRFHYIMIFPERNSLIKILEMFPDVYEFSGGTEGTFIYKKIEKERFMQIVKAVQKEGGVVVHAHPMQVMQSNNPCDYYFGDGTVIETIYMCKSDDILNTNTVNNYKLWMQMLALGYKVVNTATSDCHNKPKNIALNVVYSEVKDGKHYVDYLRKGDLNAGFVGIKMCLDDNPMGTTAKRTENSKLYIKIADAHSENYNKSDTYRLDIITDKGLAYSERIDLNFEAAFEVLDRKFYRAVVIRESDGAPVAIGNPIWLE